MTDEARAQVIARYTAEDTTTTLAELQTQLDTLKKVYNNQRPHRSPPDRTTPATAYTTRPEATSNNQ